MLDINSNLSGQVSPSFNLLDEVILPTPPEKPKEEDPNTDKFIMHSKVIDTFTVKRTRILLTPGVCDKCGLDLVNLAYSQNKLETNVYADLIPELQAIMRQLVLKHKQVSHSSAEDLIVTSKPKNWLSGRR